ncbi:hypothetical protein FBQ73_10095 [Xanthobacter autotrophicus]|uniref:Uncharacterized protein n=1 Tax=Xanthobacter autotrophicus TaxID=280 RepID=A0A6C1KFI8_XANAU|nr:hypothetical protein FBQ73_10095 [Xanthobacter autotrophicus]
MPIGLTKHVLRLALGLDVQKGAIAITAVMPGLVPGIHAVPLGTACEDQPQPARVDGRVKPGHDGGKALLMVARASDDRIVKPTPGVGR